MEKDQLKQLLNILKPNAEETLPIVFGEKLKRQITSSRSHRVPSLDYPGRFENLGLIAKGGIGEIHHVFDHAMKRSVALKTLKEEMKEDLSVMDAFLKEARLTAQLHHPGIIPVHEYGFLFNGNCYYIMPIIRGKTLSELVSDVHKEPIANRKRHIHDLVDHLLKASEAIAYAHAQQILHQDIKPSNIMIGEHGEVYVVDWGLARELLSYEDELLVKNPVGTPAYMPPERFQDQIIIALNADVYSLGATLYKILCGESPYRGDVNTIIDRIIQSQYVPLKTFVEDGFPISSALIAICETAMHADPKQRYPNAEGFCNALRDWLHGELRKKEANQIIKMARQDIERAKELHNEASAMTRLGYQKLYGIPLWAGEKEKEEGWKYLDKAKALNQEMDLAWLAHERALYSALSHAPDLFEIHASLAEHYITKLQYAESIHNQIAAAHSLAQLEAHVDAIPIHHPNKSTWQQYIEGSAVIQLNCSANVQYRLYKFVSENRRLSPALLSIGQFPIKKERLPMGSYLLTSESPNSAPFRYPFKIYRRKGWSNTPPNNESPKTLRLIRSENVREDEAHIPAGWTRVGDSTEGLNTLPWTNVWVDDFIMKVNPITNLEFITFLNELILLNQSEKALSFAPRERGGTIGDLGALIYGQNDNGTFYLRPDADGDIWQEDWPVVMVQWDAAIAYSKWYSKKTNQEWRLPHEVEWEKAARGVDGRYYPWGNHHDPSWCNMLDSRASGPLLSSIHGFSNDCSVYGVLGMAGNVADWCQNSHHLLSYPISNHLIIPELSSNSNKVFRGGSWGQRERAGLCANREYRMNDDRLSIIGFRLVRTPLESEYL